MSDTTNAASGAAEDGEFDQTNGLAGNTEGDDHGAIEDRGDNESLITEAVKQFTPDSSDENEGMPAGETPYSEEGRE